LRVPTGTLTERTRSSWPGGPVWCPWPAPGALPGSPSPVVRVVATEIFRRSERWRGGRTAN